MIVGEASRILGKDIETLTLNISIIRLKRPRHREAIATTIHCSFEPEFLLIDH